ncbi:hypothetical protein BX600DRAFT_129489 [Xylariales sp. PMI_506]|nr:hypothetical protein BX600DRAFT_129489 [Xylariales sp. PMI_506]
MGGPGEAAAAAATNLENEDPPPPYSEVGAPALPPRKPKPKNNPFFAADDSSAAGSFKMPIKFPPTFNLYYLRSVPDRSIFHLGTEEDRPLYAVTFHTSFTEDLRVVLHSDADADSGITPLAAAFQKPGRRDSTIQLTGFPTAETEELLAHAGLISTAYTFEIEIGPQRRREKFEWRPSKGSEVKGLIASSGRGVSGLGRKLVRLSAESDGVGGTRAVRDTGASSDGREVVAVWVDNPKWTMNRAGAFQFLGTGATGDLGERFRVMAVITALRIFEQNNEISL